MAKCKGTKSDKVGSPRQRSFCARITEEYVDFYDITLKDLVNDGRLTVNDILKLMKKRGK